MYCPANAPKWTSSKLHAKQRDLYQRRQTQYIMTSRSHACSNDSHDLVRISNVPKSHQEGQRRQKTSYRPAVEVFGSRVGVDGVSLIARSYPRSNVCVLESRSSNRQAGPV
jgi:hypothetical protein